jgi:hypothetical protein
MLNAVCGVRLLEWLTERQPVALEVVLDRETHARRIRGLRRTISSHTARVRPTG